jgi:post-segregation antitoxin (ccd killing protein)
MTHCIGHRAGSDGIAVHAGPQVADDILLGPFTESGMIAGAVRHSTQHWREDDLNAVAVYLKDGEKKADEKPKPLAATRTVAGRAFGFIDRRPKLHPVIISIQRFWLLVGYLRTGVNRYAIASGPMADAVRHSTQHWREDDLNAGS